MAKKSSGDTVLMLGAVAVAILVLYEIWKKLSVPKGASGLVGGGSGQNSYAPYNPQNPSMPPLQFGAGGGGSGGGNPAGGSFPPFNQTPLGKLAANAPQVDLPEDNNSLIGGFGDYSNGGAAFIPYLPLQNLPDSGLLSLDAGGAPVSYASNNDSHPSSWDNPAI